MFISNQSYFVFFRWPQIQIKPIKLLYIINVHVYKTNKNKLENKLHLQKFRHSIYLRWRDEYQNTKLRVKKKKKIYYYEYLSIF